MNLHVKVLDPGLACGFVIRAEFAIQGEEAPDVIDLPISFGQAGPLKRYKFRFRTEDTFYYTPLQQVTVYGGTA